MIVESDKDFLALDLKTVFCPSNSLDIQILLLCEVGIKTLVLHVSLFFVNIFSFEELFLILFT